MNRSIRTILESKRAARRELTNLPVNEKIALLEKLRDRALAIADSSRRRSAGSPPPGRETGAPGRQD